MPRSGGVYPRHLFLGDEQRAALDSDRIEPLAPLADRRVHVSSVHHPAARLDRAERQDPRGGWGIVAAVLQGLLPGCSRGEPSRVGVAVPDHATDASRAAGMDDAAAIGGDAASAVGRDAAASACAPNAEPYGRSDPARQADLDAVQIGCGDDRTVSTRIIQVARVYPDPLPSSLPIGPTYLDYEAGRLLWALPGGPGCGPGPGFVGVLVTADVAAGAPSRLLPPSPSGPILADRRGPILLQASGPCLFPNRVRQPWLEGEGPDRIVRYNASLGEETDLVAEADRIGPMAKSSTHQVLSVENRPLQYNRRGRRSLRLEAASRVLQVHLCTQVAGQPRNR